MNVRKLKILVLNEDGSESVIFDAHAELTFKWNRSIDFKSNHGFHEEGFMCSGQMIELKAVTAHPTIPEELDQVCVPEIPRKKV